MGFNCDAAGCTADQKKSNRIDRYPWMEGVTWVKWPRKDARAMKRWMRLIRRGGVDREGKVKDTFHPKARSRLCSRHFDSDQIDFWGRAKADPKYFAWNNWGKPMKTRPAISIQKLEANRLHHQSSTSTIYFSGVRAGSEIMDTECTDVLVPDVGYEVDCGSKECSVHIGSLTPLSESNSYESIPVPHDHIYISTPRTVVDMSVQTDLTGEDICDMENKLHNFEKSLFKARLDHKKRPIEECVMQSDTKVNFYTGIVSKDLLKGVYDSIKFGLPSLKYWSQSRTNGESNARQRATSGRKRKLEPFAEFIMTLMRMRLNLPVLLLSDLFDIGISAVSDITITWISYLHQVLVPALLVWPSQAQVHSRMPLEFCKKFSRTRVVIDCSEVYIDKPANKDEQYKTYSQYKNHNTYKFLVGVNPNGAFTFISDMWGGNVSDRYITEHSGLIDLIEEGDEVMADRGFRIEDLLLAKGAVLVAPPFTRKWSNGKGKRLNVQEIWKTRSIAKVRIHVERAIQRLKTWRILRHQMPHNLKDVSSMIVKLIAALCNLKGPLFYSKNEQHKRKAYNKI